ncbi:yehI [Escherichia coli STEC_94C]|nr:yehI [Escherichia coli STEC_94C]
MAALACIAQNDSQQLLDEIVQQEGLEYATEVVIARQFIARCYESDPLVVTLQYQDEDYGYGYRSETYNEFDLRLRKHLSLAEESCWQRCCRQTHCRTTRNNQSSPPFYCADPPGKTRNSQ